MGVVARLIFNCHRAGNSSELNLSKGYQSVIIAKAIEVAIQVVTKKHAISISIPETLSILVIVAH